MSFDQVTAKPPKPEQCPRKSSHFVSATRLLEPVQRRSQVGMIRLKPIEPGALIEPMQLGCGLLGEGEKVRGMGMTGRDLLLGHCRQLLQPKLAYGLQHPVPRFAPGTFLSPEQALVNEGGDHLIDIPVEVGPGVGDCPSCVQCEATDKRGEPAKHRAVCWSEQVIAPGDGVPQGPLAIGRIAGAAGQLAERRSCFLFQEPRHQLSRREMSNTSGSQFEGERQAIEPPADRFDSVNIGVGEFEIGACRLGPGDEELYGWRVPGAIDSRAVCGRRKRERRNRKGMFAGDLKDRAAGQQACQAPAYRQHLGHQRCSVEHVLEVVENQQSPLGAQEVGNALR